MTVAQTSSLSVFDPGDGSKSWDAGKGASSVMEIAQVPEDPIIKARFRKEWVRADFAGEESAMERKKGC